MFLPSTLTLHFIILYNISTGLTFELLPHLFNSPKHKAKMPSMQGMLRVVQPEMLEFQFEGANPLIVKLERPLFGVEEAPVTLEFESPDQLTASYPVNGRIEGTSLTLDLANGVKIVGHLHQPEAPQPIAGFGNWMG